MKGRAGSRGVKGAAVGDKFDGRNERGGHSKSIGLKGEPFASTGENLRREVREVGTACERCGNDIQENLDDPSQLEDWIDDNGRYCTWCAYQWQKSVEEE